MSIEAIKEDNSVSTEVDIIVVPPIEIIDYTEVNEFLNQDYISDE